MAQTYVTQPGDSLWSIAQRFYGDGTRWPGIHEANRAVIGDNPDYVQDGWTLTIPDQAVDPGYPGQPQTYVTTDADTLWGIAQRFYGDGARWPDIYAANQAAIGPNPDVIGPNLTLTIP